MYQCSCVTFYHSIYYIIHVFNQGIRYGKIFFNTIGREWLGIDRLRLDKFYMVNIIYINIIIIMKLRIEVNIEQLKAVRTV